MIFTVCQITQAGLDARENQLDDQDRKLSSPGSQPGERNHDRGVVKGMFVNRDREPVSCFVNRGRELWEIYGDLS